MSVITNLEWRVLDGMASLGAAQTCDAHSLASMVWIPRGLGRWEMGGMTRAMGTVLGRLVERGLMDRYSSGDSDVYQLTDAGRRAWVSQSRAVKFSSVRDSVRRQRKEVLAEVIEMIGEIPLHFYMSGCTDPQNASRILKLAKVVPCVPFPSIGTFKVELAGEHQYFTEDGFMADPENSFDVVKWRDLPLEKLIELACVLDKYLKKHWGRKTRR